MSRSTRRRVGFAALGAGLAVLLLALAIAPGNILEAQRGAVSADGYLTGVVQGPKGPEAGVWVIAETKDLPTGMIKSVVTDDQGRYVLPDMPMVNYSVWVRGYGLADSKPVTARPTVNTTNNAPALALTAIVAKDELEAAKVYPGDYWMSMLVPPAASAFPLGQQATLDNWMHAFKSNCNFCHQIGNPITRTLD